MGLTALPPLHRRLHPRGVLSSGGDASTNGLGQVAQLVEQGTENPRVGGSIPSLATLLVCIVLLTGCSPDPCDELCIDVADEISPCLPSWGVGWEELGAEGARAWRTECQAGWDAARADLEARELPAAEDQCTDAQAALGELDCATLRVLYLD